MGLVLIKTSSDMNAQCNNYSSFALLQFLAEAEHNQFTFMFDFRARAGIQ